MGRRTGPEERLLITWYVETPEGDDAWHLYGTYENGESGTFWEEDVPPEIEVTRAIQAETKEEIAFTEFCRRFNITDESVQQDILPAIDDEMCAGFCDQDLDNEYN